MELDELADTITTMIVHHDYPGFEPRALNLGLPDAALKSSPKTFAQALKHDNVFVLLAALRWFQERPGVTKNYLEAVTKLLDHSDEWVRWQAIKTLERSSVSDDQVVIKISSLLKDQNQMVRQQAAKACGKLLAKCAKKDASVIALLQEAAKDPDEKVRFKAQKSLRQLGAYAS
jgi:vesicle coat complex subunit